jgi:1,4-alpha-glucan branching enzyme
MMLSEGSLPEHHVKAFDITYAWNTYDILEQLLSGRKPASFLDQVLTSESLRFPRGSLRMRFNTNHDKNAWDMPAVAKFGLDGLKLTTVLVNTIPGVPLMYTGEEVANSKRLDLFEKVSVDWTQPRTIGDLARELHLLRKDGTALSRGTMTRLRSDHDGEVFAFVRASEKEELLIVLSFSAEPKEYSVELSEGFGGNEIELSEVRTGQVIRVSSGVNRFPTGTIEPKGFRIYSVKRM